MSDPEDHSAHDQLQDPARGDMPVRDADFARRRAQQTDDPRDGATGGEGNTQEKGEPSGDPRQDDVAQDEAADERSAEGEAKPAEDGEE
jgi:hypothetical protein